MKPTFPLELRHVDALDRQSIYKIGDVDVLFPAYQPRVDDRTFMAHTQRLNDTNRYMKVEAYRKQNDSIVYLIWKRRRLMNAFVFHKDAFDSYAVDYLQRYSGWPSRLLPTVQAGFAYANARIDMAERVYEWELMLSRQRLSWDAACALIADELATHSINIDYEVVVKEPGKTEREAIGSCRVDRNAGWISRPSYLCIKLQRQPFLYVVLHEIAHALDGCINRINNHGPTFLLIYARLLEKHFGLRNVARDMRRFQLYERS